MGEASSQVPEQGTDIAVVGMAGRFPGAPTIGHFWKNLRDGVESVKFFSEEELLEAGESPEMLRNPAYVKACPVLEGIDRFDAGFFGFSPKDAAIMDPQHRFFLETAWHAFEDAGYVPGRYPGPVGVFASCGMNTYMMYHLVPNPWIMQSVGEWLVRHTGNDMNFLATRVSYELNLTGPSMNVQTACSSALVAIHLASQSLLNGECDMAMAGGVTILLPQNRGYLWKEGEILSPDGHCRSFDARSQGTIFGSGVGAVVLKRVADAIRDGDNIRAVIKGSAVNNDGSQKVGYLAPSVEGQAKAIAEALALSGVEPETISYLEAHGSGTLVGDPIEMTAITQAFRASTDKKGFCAIGSVKTNIGHLGETGGAAGFIKTVLALEHRQLPPSLHYEEANSQIDFASSPFFVNSKLTPWSAIDGLRRAGVTALGAGGTNAHIIVEEAPPTPPSADSGPAQLLLLSAKTEKAVERAARNLAAYLRENPELNLADAAYTLQVGRKEFSHRRIAVCRDAAEAVRALEGESPERAAAGKAEAVARSAVFMFTGQGAQYPNMGRAVYEAEPLFRDEVDRCCRLLKPHLGLDLKSVLFPAPEAQEEAKHKLQQTALTQPALFVVEYAMARLWMAWGIKPQAMIGHSIGEYVAACLAGVFSLEDALRLVAVRGRLMQELPGGCMMAVPLSEAELTPLLGPAVSLAAVNSPSLCVVSGAEEDLAALEKRLTEKEITARRLHTSHAFHSPVMEAIMEPLAQEFRKLRLLAPQLPYLSNLTGKWIAPDEATDPLYWARHARQAVRFSDGLQQIWSLPHPVLIEVGPGQTLCTLARQHSDKPADAVNVPSLPPANAETFDYASTLVAAGRLWVGGLGLDWAALHGGRRRRRISLPGYAFEPERHWIEPGEPTARVEAPNQILRKKKDIGDWFYLPSWKRTLPPAPATKQNANGGDSTYLIFADPCGLGSKLKKRLKHEPVVTVSVGEKFSRLTDSSYSLRPDDPAHYQALFRDLQERKRLPKRIVYLWGVTEDDAAAGVEQIERSQGLFFDGLVLLAQTWGAEEEPVDLWIISNQLHQIGSDPALQPVKALLLGPARVIPREYPHIRCQSVDVLVPDGNARQEALLIDQILAEMESAVAVPVIALRGADRFVQVFEPVQLAKSDAPPPALRREGVYLITGGLGGIGYTLAEHFAKMHPVKLVLTGRRVPPTREEWNEALSSEALTDAVKAQIRDVQHLESLGAEVLVLKADVTSRDQMKAALAQARKQFGEIHGVIHAAGLLDDGLMQLKSLDAARRVLAPKVKGALVLDALFKDQPLDFLVYCSSVGSILGLPGQVDYASANAFLDAFAQFQTVRRQRRTVAVNWSGWRDVGMLSRLLDGNDSTGSRTKPRHPLLEQRRSSSSSEVVFETEFRRGKQWVLSEHVIRGGDAVIPGAGHLELVRAALEEQPQSRSVEIRNAVFLTPFVVQEGQTRPLRVKLRKSGGAFSFSISSDQDREHVTGEVEYVEVAPPKQQDLAAIVARCDAREDIRNGFLDQVFFQFGPRWGNIQKIRYGDKEALVALELPSEFHADLAEYRMHPALLDMATGGAQPLIPGFDLNQDFYVPFSYGKLTLHQAFPSQIFSHIRYKENNGQDVAVFDVTLFDAHGVVLAEIRDFTLKRVTKAAMRMGSETTAATGSRAAERSDESATNSPASSLMETVLREGITPAEGIQAFDRILASPVQGQIVASALDLQVWSRQIDGLKEDEKQAEEAPQPAAGFSRPNLPTAYVAPRSDLEKHLAQLWEELLGVKGVGIEDNFFELGGHSLIAVRLFTKIKKAYRVDFALATLFKAPTVEKCAALIEEEMQQQQAVASGMSAPVEKVDRWSSLVPIQPLGSKMPFFLIHGWGGNVLNFYDLARHLGTDQPVYGLQSWGLDGKHVPHTRIEEMAAHYINEIRTIRPEGPYLLGGMSMGGTIGFEMAQQLQRQGEKVALLALFDTVLEDTEALSYFASLSGLEMFRRKAAFWGRRISFHVVNLVKLSAKEKVAYVRKATKTLRRRFRSRIWKRRFNPETFVPGATQDVLKLVNETNNLAAKRYEPRVYPGAAVLFRATDQKIVGPNDPEEIWRHLAAGGLTVHPVPGDHLTLLGEPNVQFLAEKLKVCLEEAAPVHELLYSQAS